MSYDSIPKVGLVYDPIMGNHKDNDFHWERPERIWSIYQILLNNFMLPLLKPVTSRPVTFEELCFAHTPKYIERITKQLQSKYPGDSISDRDMYANEDSLISAKLAAGSVIELTKQVLEGKLESGFAIVRPPGHHATSDRCMGFCFFNNLGIAAMMAAKSGKRVLIVDWDVHEGNGTHEIIERNPEIKNLLFFSIHKWDYGKFYPGTGKSKSTDRVVYVGFNGSKGDDFYIKTLRETLLPRAKEFKPDIIFVSCGFDAAEGDPLGGCQVTPKGYHLMTKMLQMICPKIVLVLEGGYDLKAISLSALACIKSLLDLPLEVHEASTSTSRKCVQSKQKQ